MRTFFAVAIGAVVGAGIAYAELNRQHQRALADAHQRAARAEDALQQEKTKPRIATPEIMAQLAEEERIHQERYATDPHYREFSDRVRWETEILLATYQDEGEDNAAT